MSDGTPRPGDDAHLRAWRRRYAEETERSVSLRLPLALARRLRAEAAARDVPHSRDVADLLRAARPPRRPRPRRRAPAAGRRTGCTGTGRVNTDRASARRAGPGPRARPAHHPAPSRP